MDDCIQNVHMAIENGHQELAAKIVSESVRVGNFGYNYLHEEVTFFLLLSYTSSLFYFMETY